MPEGEVNKKYSSIPALAAITPDKIRITPASMQHISNIFIKRMYDLNLDTDLSAPLLEPNIINAIRTAIPHGIVLSNHPAQDSHNPMDRQIEIYIGINLSNIDSGITGTAKLKVMCRLSVFNNTLTLRSIERNFRAG